MNCICHRTLPTIILAFGLIQATAAQPPDDEGDTASRRAEEVLNQPSRRPASPEDASDSSSGGVQASINLLQLIWTARWLMLPIILMSVVVVTVGIERALSLRRRSVIPPPIVRQIYEATEVGTAFNTRQLFHTSVQYPSPMATVLQAVLQKIGRPPAEVERAVTDTMQRESERLYRNVRTLNLAAAVTPLMGLLGTVWGMIEAFFATANLPVGANKAESLAEGIYTALVTTAGGLVVAIPAAILAHLFEGQIQRVFLDIHDLIASRLMPHVERLEGQTGTVRAKSPPPTPPPVTSAVTVK